METYKALVEAFVAAGFAAIQSDVPGYKRTYFPLTGPQGQDAGMYLEVQCWEDGKFGVHVDTVEGLPGIVANAIAQVAGQGVMMANPDQFIIPLIILSALPGSAEVAVMTRSPQAGFWKPQSTKEE